MKKILFAIFICSLYSLCVQAQCYNFYVKTPKNSNVKACTSGGYSPSQVQSADTYSRTFAISSSYVYEAGTNSYNCHGYAWHVKEGGSKVWINNVRYEANNLNTYWTDGSYSAYNYASQPHVENLKVFYGNDDHTAITTSNSNIFISKMGCGALVGHHRDNSPYTEGNFTYYKRIPTLSGPTLVLNAGSTYTLSGGGGGTVTWTYSPSLQKLSSSNTSITVKPNYNAAGWIQASVGGISTPRFEVWAGKPVVKVEGPNIGFTYQSTYFSATVDDKAAVFDYDWTLSPVYSNLVFDNNLRFVEMVFYNSGYYSVSARATNANGTGLFAQYPAIINDRSRTSAFKVYPNPADNELTVSLNTSSVTPSPPLSPAASVAPANKSCTVYLQNANGTTVRQSVVQTGEVRLDVSGLPNGIYYLIIDTGDGARPESHKIIVKH